MPINQLQKSLFSNISVLILFHGFDALPQHSILIPIRNNALNSLFLKFTLIYSGFNCTFRSKQVNFLHVVFLDSGNTSMYNMDNLSFKIRNFIIYPWKKQMRRIAGKNYPVASCIRQTLHGIRHFINKPVNIFIIQKCTNAAGHCASVVYYDSRTLPFPFGRENFCILLEKMYRGISTHSAKNTYAKFFHSITLFIVIFSPSDNIVIIIRCVDIP